MIRTWIAWWDRTERPDVLAFVRIGVGIVLLYDFLTIGRLGLVDSLFTSREAGGLVAATTAWTEWVGGDAFGGRLLHASLVAASLALTLGVSSRLSALVLGLLSAQFAHLLPDADRAIDMQLRNVLLILAFSAAGDAWSVDAWWRSGRLRGGGEERPAWPRYLVVLQVVVMYFTAGVQKYAQQWWPWGDYLALWVILHDWSYAAADFDWTARQPFRFGLQLSTAVTMAWQWTYPVVLVHYFPLARPPGRFRATFERYRLHWLWIAVGALFHVLIAATMQLGIFPYGMLALYPAFLHPDELRALAPARARE